MGSGTCISFGSLDGLDISLKTSRCELPLSRIHACCVAVNEEE